MDFNYFKQLLNHMLQFFIKNILGYQDQVYLSILVSDILVTMPFACTKCEKSKGYKCMIWHANRERFPYRLQLYRGYY